MTDPITSDVLTTETSFHYNIPYEQVTDSDRMYYLDKVIRRLIQNIQETNDVYVQAMNTMLNTINAMDKKIKILELRIMNKEEMFHA